MKCKRIASALLFALFFVQTFSQNPLQTVKSSIKDSFPDYKFTVGTTYLTFLNIGPEKTNTHHYEFHLGYKLTPKDKIGIKFASWQLFAPMGIPLGDPLFLKESEFFPGRLKEIGLGVTYQRFVWKGLFASIEVLPLFKTYVDEDAMKIGNGFKLYTTCHLGYHIPLLKDRLYIEPQLHCNYWPIDTNIPEGFKQKESKWNNYFLYEPNIYIGVNF